MRTKKNTHQEVRNGFFKKLEGKDETQINAAVQRAQKAWSENKKCLVWRHQAFTNLNDDALTEILDRILTIGVVLFDTAMVFNTVGLNTEVAMFTFLRPKD